MMTLLGLPLAFSGLVIACGFILAFGRAPASCCSCSRVSAVTRPAIGMAGSTSVSGLGFAYANCLLPRVALFAVRGVRQPRPAPGAGGAHLGRYQARAFWDTVVPEVMPSVLSNACMVAAIAMGTYGTALALVGTRAEHPAADAAHAGGRRRFRFRGGGGACRWY